MNRIDEDIKNGSFAGLYLLYGEEDYLRHLYVSRLKKAILPDDDEMNLHVWREKGLDMSAFQSQALTMPFFAEHRLIMVEDCGLFKKGGADMADFLKNLPQETIVIFSESEVDARGKLFKLFKTAGVVMECKHLRDDDLMRWIVRRFDKAGRKVQRSAIQLFMERSTNDMQTINTEIDKLIAYTHGRDAIMLEDVQAVTTVNLENRIFDMIDAIAGRQQQKALELCGDLLAMKEPPLRILALMGRQFDRLCQIKELRNQGLDQTSISDRLGMQGFIVRKGLGQCAAFTMEELRQALEACVQSDTDIKTGRMRDTLALETLIIRITQNDKT